MAPAAPFTRFVATPQATLPAAKRRSPGRSTERAITCKRLCSTETLATSVLTTACSPRTSCRAAKSCINTDSAERLDLPVRAATDRLYITNEDGHTFVLAKGSEYKLLGENDVGETVMASAAISGNVLYVRGRNHLFAIGAR